MNKIILSGNLTKDVELRYTPSGKAFARVGIGVSRKVKNSDGKYDSDFFNLVAWDKTAEFFGRYLAKGSKVLIEGRLQNNDYTDKNGVKHYAVDVIVENVEFAGSKVEKKSDEPKDEFDGTPVNDDDMPF